MNKMMPFRSLKKFFSDRSYYYILFAVGFACLFISLRPYTQFLYETGLTISGILFLGVQQEKGRISANKRGFLLPGIMVAWFLFLQVKRSFAHVDLDNIGIFVSVYLFAFPLASVLREQDRNRGLKIFAGAYFTASVILVVDGLMLICNCLPEFMTDYVYWDGARLVTFWHPNIVGCYLMIGIIFCTVYLTHAKSIWSKISLSILLVLMAGMMALTGCRTATILTGGYFGSVIFYRMLRRGRKWFIPAVFAVLIITVAFYSVERVLFDANSDRLIKMYAQAYSEQIVENSLPESTAETELLLEEVTEPEENIIHDEVQIATEETVQEGIATEKTTQEELLPITVDPDSGEVSLITENMQGDITRDLGTFNSRTYIWSAAKLAIQENPAILYWGTANPGEYVSHGNSFSVVHLHNAWMECLVGMGAVGFLIALVFTTMAAWNCLIVLIRHYQDTWKRAVALLVLCLLAASMLEPYLFYTISTYNLTELIFFLCAGYLAYWQEEDNRCIRRWIRKRLSLVKK